MKRHYIPPKLIGVSNRSKKSPPRHSDLWLVFLVIAKWSDRDHEHEGAFRIETFQRSGGYRLLGRWDLLQMTWAIRAEQNEFATQNW